jgi:hypothetical protein
MREFMVNTNLVRTKRLSCTGLMMAVVLACLLIGACGTPSKPTRGPSETGASAPPLSAADPAAVKSLRFHEGDATSLEHMDIVILPQGEDGQPLNIEGTLTVKLWELADPVNNGLGDLLGEWTGVQVTAKEFTSAGMLVKLDFHGFRPAPGLMGYLELEVTAGGRSLKAEGPFQVLKESCCLTTSAP